MTAFQERAQEDDAPPQVLHAHHPSGVEVDEDTDGDGYGGGSDRALGNMMLQITIVRVNRVNPGVGNAFFALKYIDGECFATDRVYFNSGAYQEVNFNYYIDVPDDLASVTPDIQAWQDGLFGDSQLRFNGNSNCESPTYYFNIDSPLYESWYGNDIDVNMIFRTVAEQRSNVIVINGTAGGGYGLEETENGLRYSADEQMYVIYVNNQGRSTTNFDSGLNTILLPRSVALECMLNYTFADLQNRLSGTVFSEAKVFGGDDSHTVNSKNILMVIYVNLTIFQTDDLLYDLTHNATGSVIGHHTKVSGDDLYLLHLPMDVLNAVISKGFTSSAFGEGPEAGFQWLMNTIYECLISALTFFIELGSDLIELGMKVLGELWGLTQEVIDSIESTIDKIVDAFQAFVTWAVEFITDLVTDIFGPFIDDIKSYIFDYLEGVNAAVDRAALDFSSTGMVSDGSQRALGSALTGELFTVLLGIAVVIDILLIALTPVTSVFGMIVAFVAPIVVAPILSEVFSYINGDDGVLSGPVNDALETLSTWTRGVLESLCDWTFTSSKEQTAWGAFGGCMSILGTFVGAGGLVLSGAAVMKEAFYLALSIVGSALGWFAMAVGSFNLSVVAIFVSAVPLVYSVVSTGMTPLPSARIVAGISALFGGVGIYCSIKSLE